MRVVCNRNKSDVGSDMKRISAIKGIVVVVVIAALVAGSLVYAGRRVFDVDLPGTVQLGVSVTDPIQIFSGNGVTPVNGGDQIAFGAAEVDYFGRGPVPVRGPYFVKNQSSGLVHVIVTGDFGDNIVPLFGPNPGELAAAP